MQGILPDLSSSQVEAGKGTEEDELCIGERTKSTRFDRKPLMLREPRHDGSNVKHRISCSGFAL